MGLRRRVLLVCSVVLVVLVGATSLALDSGRESSDVALASEPVEMAPEVPTTAPVLVPTTAPVGMPPEPGASLTDEGWPAISPLGAEAGPEGPQPGLSGDAGVDSVLVPGGHAVGGVQTRLLPPTPQVPIPEEPSSQSEVPGSETASSTAASVISQAGTGAGAAPGEPELPESTVSESVVSSEFAGQSRLQGFQPPDDRVDEPVERQPVDGEVLDLGEPPTTVVDGDGLDLEVPFEDPSVGQRTGPVQQPREPERTLDVPKPETDPADLGLPEVPAEERGLSNPPPITPSRVVRPAPDVEPVPFPPAEPPGRERTPEELGGRGPLQADDLGPRPVGPIDVGFTTRANGDLVTTGLDVTVILPGQTAVVATPEPTKTPEPAADGADGTVDWFV